MNNVSELLELLELEPLEVNLFRGQSHSIGSPRVFGGQVLAQALQAAILTVPEDRFVHSLHSYFILPGDIHYPIVFNVERARDGGSFTTRRVQAIQNGKTIFVMAASFQLDQDGYDHQATMPEVPDPENFDNWDELREKFSSVLPENIRKFLDIKRPIEFRPVMGFPNPFKPGVEEPIRRVWMRAKGEMPNDRLAHQCLLAYASDYDLLTTSLLPHGSEAFFKDIQLASIDHAMWFHRHFRMDDWLLYDIDSPSASNARGFNRGSIYSRDGILVASVVQEGLIRPSRKKG